MSNSKKKSNKKRRRSSKRLAWWVEPLIVFCLFADLLIAFIAFNEFSEYGNFKVMRSNVEGQSFYNGVRVEGYGMAEVSLDYALNYWDQVIEPKYRERSVVFNVEGDSYCLSAQDAGYNSNYKEVINNAWNAGRSGSLEERYRSLKEISVNVREYSVARNMYDENVLRAYTNALAASYTKPTVNAQIQSFDVNTHAFQITESSEGTYVDADALYAQAAGLLAAGGGELRVEVEREAPLVSSASLNTGFGMITQAVTRASSSGSNRLTNLKLACQALNGVCVQPGETFSFNGTVGERSKARGYKKATVYQSGDVAEDYGGGVCQVSTTLWNAAMKANCESVERHEHSMPVAYVDKGKDATVSWSSQDMKFKNTSDYPMYIIAYLSSDKKVYCEIYGKLFDNGGYIKIEAKTTKTIAPPAPVYTYNPALGPGKFVVISDQRTGYKASAYRVYYNASGKEVNRELLCSSYYKEAAAKVEYGT